ncbi:DUF4391 domain-containing protein [Butyrivibrio sp. FC2001]|uniref:DUF4391 domain-containing protein n=1 Tax=Butyrivibrio sp. FC2001 TaxID=1280671 RepID=UPI000406F3A6|nr:DUF4391 domain-containing protein [Butyrivibrio sp. FC2001]
MFDIPKRFETNLDIKLKDFIPKELNPNDKRRIKESVRSVKMTYQIAGEEIPSLVNDEYRCQVIQFYEIELENIKDANFIASIYQGLIKPLCIMRFYDSKDEEYSFADKRLSQTEENQIVVEDLYLSQKYPYGLPGEGIGKYLEYLSFDKIKNKTDKLVFYREWFYKLYLLEHKSAYINTELLLSDNVWYSESQAIQIYHTFVELVKAREDVTKIHTNADKIIANKEIKKIIKKFENWRRNI